jgi:hypothetical protein
MSITDHPAYKAIKEREELEAEALKEQHEQDFLLFTEAVREYAYDNTQLLLSKHRDYGPTNISNAPGGALNGLRVRIHDKVARINHLIDNGAEPENEALRDSFLDLANYALIAQLVIDGKWPK